MATTITKNDLPANQIFNKILSILNPAKVTGKLVSAIIRYVPGVNTICIGIAGFIDWFAGTSLVQKLLKWAGALPSLDALFVLIGGVAPRLYSFNWNMSDKEIEDQLKNSIQTLYGQVGEVTGQAIGWLVCGILPATVTFAFNPGIAAIVMENLAEEAKEEIWGSLAACQQSAVAMLGNALILHGFKSARRWLKRPNTPMYQLLKQHFGSKFEQWGKDNQPSWSMSQQVENDIENIKDPNWRNFAEEFVDGFIDGCSEAIQTYKNEMGQAMAAYAAVRRQEQKAQSKQMVVQLDFSRDDDEEQPPATT